MRRVEQKNREKKKERDVCVPVERDMCPLLFRYTCLCRERKTGKKGKGGGGESGAIRAPHLIQLVGAFNRHTTYKRRDILGSNEPRHKRAPNNNDLIYTYTTTAERNTLYVS